MPLRFHLLIPSFVVLLRIPSVNRTSAQGSIDDATLLEAGQKTPVISTAEIREILREYRDHPTSER